MRGRLTVVAAALAVFLWGGAAPAMDLSWTEDQEWAQDLGVARPTAEEQLSYAGRLENDDDYLEASRQYLLFLRQYGATDPDNTGIALVRLGKCLHSSGNHLSAFDALELAIHDYPNSNSRLDLLNMELAIGGYLYGLHNRNDIRPPSAEMLARRETDIRLAARIFTAVVAHDPDGPVAPEALYTLGQMFFEFGDIPAAREAFEQLLEDHPKFRFADNVRRRLAEWDQRDGELANADSDGPPEIPEEGRDPKWAVPLELAGAPNLARVSPILYRGAQPTAEGFRNLHEQLGIKYVVSFRQLHSDRSLIGNLPMKYTRIAWNALHAEEEDIVRFLKIVGDPENHPVFIHCWHGVDRTGTMAAVYRIVIQGWSREEAVREMTDGFQMHARLYGNLLKFVRTADFDKMRIAAGLPPPPTPEDNASSAEAVSEEVAVAVTVTKEGEFFIDGEMMTFEDIEGRLRNVRAEMASDREYLLLDIRMDTSAGFELMKKILDAAQRVEKTVVRIRPLPSPPADD